MPRTPSRRRDGEPPATGQGDSPPPAWTDTTLVGKAVPRIDAYERVSGGARFPSDVILPDMLYAAVLRSPHAHATVKRVDTSAAQRMPGVRAVMTSATPGARVPWYLGPDGKPLSVLFDPHCRFEGEEVAAVAAETPYQAWDAVRAISVEYELLPFVSTEEEALRAGAPLVHPGGNQVGKTQVSERGDVDAGFKQADIVLETTFRTSCELHTTTEPHGSVATWEGPHLTIWDSTQGVFFIQAGVAEALDLPIAHVRVIGHYVGGGFGSKIDTSKHTIIAALWRR